MDTQQYAGLVYQHTTQQPPFLDNHARPAPLNHSPQDMAWHTQTSPPNSSSSSEHSSHLYSTMNRSSERLDYASPSTPAFIPRHPSDNFTNHHQQSPTLDHNPSNHPMSFDSPQIESSIGPSRILTRRRARAAAQSHDQEEGSSSGASSHTYDLPQNSLAFAGQPMSRPHTPGGMVPSEPPPRPRDGATPLPTSSQYSMPPSSVSPYTYMPSHSRSTSGSTSNPRSASPALSVASALTSVSSSTSGPPPQGYVYPNGVPMYAPPVITRAKHRKQRLFSTDRKKICQFHAENPGMKQEQIAAHFGVERSTISKILKHKAKWLHVPEHEENPVAKQRPSKFPHLERCLERWLIDCRNKSIILTDSLIRTKAKEVARNMGLGDDRFKASSGWVENFKHRQGIRRGVFHGEGTRMQRVRINTAFYPSQKDFQRPDELAHLPDMLPPELPPPPPPLDAGMDQDFESDDEDARLRHDGHDMDPSTSLRPAWQEHGHSPMFPDHSGEGVSHSPVAPHDPDAPVEIPDHVPVPIHRDDGDGHDGETVAYVTPQIEICPPIEIPTVREAEEAMDKVLAFLRAPEQDGNVTDDELLVCMNIKKVLWSLVQRVPFDRTTVIHPIEEIRPRT
ncbi:hypothetical protein AcV5_007446 [Taiwanofungus camphoratus]|nr:hypothetical protein AcV5_007446 [Antrodia cinnamomea]